MTKPLINYQQTAVLANSVEVLACYKKNKLIKIAALELTPLFDFIKKNFPASRIIKFHYHGPIDKALPWSLEVDGLIKQGDLAERLKDAGVKNFLVPYRSSAWLEKWSKQNGFNLLTTPFALQNKLEDKAYFDRLLKKKAISSPATYHLSSQFKLPFKDQSYVAQQAKVSDYFRTTFLKNNQELRRFIKANKVKLGDLVVRQYLPGLPIGVSIFLDGVGNYFFSALRRQCFNYQGGFPKDFIGLQWLRFFDLSAVSRRRLQHQLHKLTMVLAKENFSGVANVDFIAYHDKIFILECNPRLSVAMPQIFNRSDLSVYKLPFDFYLNAFVKSDAYAKIKSIKLPLTTFTGAVLELAAIKKFKVGVAAPVGIYSLTKKGKIKFIGSRISLLDSSPRNFLFFHELIKGMVLKRGYSLATVFANFPLFNTATGQLNDAGRLLWDYFNKVITK